tara:strand:- start:682 stop:1056 length:375 start_codon:yes stop_codon:yes gene_type:complete
MEKNEKIEVSFVTDKQLWMDLKALCSKKKEIFKGLKTPKFGHRFLIKDAATEAIRRYLRATENNGQAYHSYDSNKLYLNKRYLSCLGEYKSLKKKYKYAIYALCLIGTPFVLNCIILLSRYLGV